MLHETRKVSPVENAWKSKATVLQQNTARHARDSGTWPLDSRVAPYLITDYDHRDHRYQTDTTFT